MVTARGKWVGNWTQVGGRAMYARVSVGSPAGARPMVLVHGLGVSGRYMMPTADRLAPDFPTYVPDLPGFGRSAKPPGIPGVPGLTDALAAWMRALGLADVCMVGNSLGCQYILDLAWRYPELIDRAVLVGPTVDPRARTMWGQIARGVLDLSREPISYWPLLTWDYLVAGPIRTLVTLHHALHDPMLEKLPRLQLPVLVGRGSRDPIAPQRWVDEMAALLPHGRVLVIPGAAHVANYSAPDALAAAVRDFVAEPNPATHGRTPAEVNGTPLRGRQTA